MIKVLFIISNLNPQGPINQLLYLCKYLDKAIIEPIIVTTSQKKFENSLHKEFKENSVRIIDLKLDKINSIFSATDKIQYIIDEQKIDIIQSFGFRSDIISYRLKRVYRLTTVRNTLLFNLKMIYGPIAGYIFGNINLHYIRKFDDVVACSRSVHDYLQTLNLNSKVILNAIESSNLNEDADKLQIKKTLLKKLDLTDHNLNFITVSSNLKGKNIEFLVESFSKDELASYTLIVVGFVNQQVVEKLKKSKNIKFTGKVNNLSDYFKASDYFISASFHEGMPNAVLEALSVGTPVILSDIPSHKEIIENCRLHVGEIFKNNDFSELKKSMDTIINYNQTELSINCRIAIRQYFSAKNMAKHYESLFSSIKGSNYTNHSL